MAKCCIDTNVFIAVAKILHFRRLEKKIDKIESGKNNSLYPILRSIKGLSGKELCTVKSVVDELDRGINPNATGGSPRVQVNREKIGYLYPLIKDLIKSKLQVFAVPSEVQEQIKGMKDALFNFKTPDGKVKNIYTDYRLYRECVDNGISCVLSRNSGDFEFCYMFQENLIKSEWEQKKKENPEFNEQPPKPRKITVIRPSDLFFKEANERFIPKFTNSMAGRLLESMYKEGYL